MKKNFNGFAALLFAAIFSLSLLTACDFAPPADGDEPPLFTADGRPLRYVTINTESLARNMSPNQAKSQAEYFEVTFFDGTAYYTASGKKNQRLRLAVPDGTYDNTSGNGTAVVLAGKLDKTLLGIGTLATSSQAISSTTTSVSFDITALKTAIQAAASSTFEITDGDGAGGVTTAGGTIAAAGTFAGEFGTIGAAPGSPWFKVGPGLAIATPAKATFNIGIADNNLLALINVPEVAYEAVQSIGGVTGYTQSSISDGKLDGSFTNFATLDTVAPAGVISLKFATSAVDGFAPIYVMLPVKALTTSASATPPKATTWYIQSGIDLDKLDLNSTSLTASTTTGGLILLAVGTPAEDSSGGGGGQDFGFTFN